MASRELEKHWRVITTILKRARRTIPLPSPEFTTRFSELDVQFDDFITHNELGLALDVLEEIGNAIECRAGFWRDLERAATVMDLNERARHFHTRFLSTKQRH